MHPTIQPPTANLSSLEQAETTTTEATKHAGLELREHADRLVMQTPHEKELANAQIENSRQECPSWRQSVYAENGWTRRRAGADIVLAIEAEMASKPNEKNMKSDGIWQRGTM